MKVFVFVAIAVWLLCGIGGLWMLGYDHIDVLAVAKGPFTLANAFADAPALTRVPT